MKKTKIVCPNCKKEFDRDCIVMVEIYIAFNRTVVYADVTRIGIICPECKEAKLQEVEDDT